MGENKKSETRVQWTKYVLCSKVSRSDIEMSAETRSVHMKGDTYAVTRDLLRSLSDFTFPFSPPPAEDRLYNVTRKNSASLSLSLSLSFCFTLCFALCFALCLSPLTLSLSFLPPPLSHLLLVFLSMLSDSDAGLQEGV